MEAAGIISTAVYQTLPGTKRSSVLRPRPLHAKSLSHCWNRPINIYRLRVTLDAVRAEEPLDTFSRTIEIEEDNTLFDLHWEIQSTFGWDNDHLYSFHMRNEVGDMQSEYAGDPVGGDVSSTLFGAPRSAAQTELRTLGLEQGKQFKYLFDYGDDLIMRWKYWTSTTGEIKTRDIHVLWRKSESRLSSTVTSKNNPRNAGFFESRSPAASAQQPCRPDRAVGRIVRPAQGCAGRPTCFCLTYSKTSLPSPVFYGQQIE